ncbi:MAG TPA: PAS domain-containing protein [Rhizomicrobium sp.]
MNTPSGAPASFIAAPRHPDLKHLLEYWTARRGARMAPARADIRPAQIKTLLADVMIWNVDADGGPYTIRLVGDSIVRFVGRNNTGADATTGMPEDAAAMMTAVLTRVARERAPLFRIGKVYWLPDKSYRDFEACYLPLSSDGETVDLILGGVKFDVGA